MASRFSIFDVKGIPQTRREQVKAAVVAGGQHLTEDYEAWIVPSRRPPAYAVRVIGPRGFYREVRFAGHETEREIIEQVRQALQIAVGASNGTQ